MSQSKADQDFQQQLLEHRTLLEQRGLFIEDPRDFPGLTSAIDPATGLDPAFPPIIYHTKETIGEMVPCSVCAKKTLHNWGFIVRTSKGKTGLVGNECAETHFGVEVWHDVTQRHRVTVRRVINEVRRGSAADQLAAVADRIADWARSLRLIDKFQADFSEWTEDRVPALERGRFGWFFQNIKLGDGVLKLAERARQLSIEWRDEGGGWTEQDARQLRMLRELIVKLHRRHQSAAGLVDDAEWLTITRTATHASKRWQYTFTKRTRKAWVFDGEWEGHLRVPESLGEPPPDLTGLLDALPVLDNR